MPADQSAGKKSGDESPHSKGMPNLPAADLPMLFNNVMSNVKT
jgi:hypothetical protein